jgi:hypothetical protein
MEGKLDFQGEFAFNLAARETPRFVGTLHEVIKDIVDPHAGRLAVAQVFECQLDSRRRRSEGGGAFNSQIRKDVTRLALRDNKAVLTIGGNLLPSLRLSAAEDQNAVRSEEIRKRGCIATVRKPCKVAKQTLNLQQVNITHQSLLKRGVTVDNCGQQRTGLFLLFFLNQKVTR